MNQAEVYRSQVQLLIRLLPFVSQHPYFALKGGTAINLFYRDLPRLSVDIDLVYLPLESRAQSLTTISKELETLSNRIKDTMPGVRCTMSGQTKLIVRANNAQVKIEVNGVVRGTVHQVQQLMVSEATEREFGWAEAQVVAFEDLYAGKICAALDRQHPRDLFDCQQLLADSSTLPPALIDTLVVYMISHNRPIAELLKPNLLDISQIYQREFKAMPRTPVTLAQLETTRLALFSAVQSGLSSDHKEFLMSFKALAPEWGKLPLTNVENLPAVRWKLQNIGRMSASAHQQAVATLRQTLQFDDAV